MLSRFVWKVVLRIYTINTQIYPNIIFDILTKGFDYQKKKKKFWLLQNWDPHYCYCILYVGSQFSHFSMRICFHEVEDEYTTFLVIKLSRSGVGLKNLYLLHQVNWVVACHFFLQGIYRKLSTHFPLWKFCYAISQYPYLCLM